MKRKLRKTKTGGNVRGTSIGKPIRNHKDTIFRMLFNDPKELLELYNCINGSSYTNPEDLTITTLENAIYLNVKNDISFVVDGTLSLYEHQSFCKPESAASDASVCGRCVSEAAQK